MNSIGFSTSVQNSFYWENYRSCKKFSISSPNDFGQCINDSQDFLHCLPQCRTVLSLMHN